jgi:hypothetical protein
VVLSPFHSAEAQATVNEHSDIAKEKEVARSPAQALLRIGTGQGWSARIGTHIPKHPGG